MDFAAPADHRIKLKESKKKDKYLDFVRDLKELWNIKSYVYTNCNWSSWYSHRRINNGTGGRGNKRTSEDHPNYCNIEIGQNTEKCHGGLRRLAVNETSGKNHQLTLM